MVNAESILAAVLSLRDATERSFQRLEREMARRFGDVARRFEKLDVRVGALETRLDRFEVKVLERFDALDARLTTVERG